MQLTHLRRRSRWHLHGQLLNRRCSIHNQLLMHMLRGLNLKLGQQLQLTQHCAQRMRTLVWSQE
jgi:hypothetical protein